MNRSIVCILLVLLWNISHADDVKVTHPSEIVLILDDYELIAYHDFDRMVETVNQFPNYFALSESGVRMAVVKCGNVTMDYLKLTGNEEMVRSFRVARRPRDTWAGIDQGLLEAKNIFQTDARSNVAKIVILIMGPLEGKPDGEEPLQSIKDAADKLRKDGASIFVGYCHSNRHKLAKDIAVEIAGNDNRVLKFDTIRSLKYEFVRKLPTLINCNVEMICHFNKNGPCTLGWWRPMVSNVDCDNQPPRQNEIICEADQCNKTCEKWQWKTTCNQNSTGQQVIMQRDGPAQQKGVFEYCPTETILCSMNGSTASASTSHGESTVSTTHVTETESSGNTTKRQLIDDVDDAIEDNESENSKEKDDDGEFPIWLIVVCVIVACAMIALIITAVVIDRKIQKAESRRAKQAKMENVEKKTRNERPSDPYEQVSPPSSPSYSRRKKKKRKVKSSDRSPSMSAKSDSSTSSGKSIIESKKSLFSARSINSETVRSSKGRSWAMKK